MVFYRCRRPGSFENRSGDGRSTPPVSSPSTGGGEPFPSTGKGWIGVRPCGMRLIFIVCGRAYAHESLRSEIELFLWKLASQHG